MYILEYTTNPAIMKTYGPTYCVSLFKMQPVRIDIKLDATEEGDFISFRTKEEKGFRIRPVSITFQGGKYVCKTTHNTYIFRKA